jgi:hypothetical protein
MATTAVTRELDSAINAKPAEAAELVVCFVHNNYYVVHTY